METCLCNHDWDLGCEGGERLGKNQTQARTACRVLFDLFDFVDPMRSKAAIPPPRQQQGNKVAK